MTKILVVVESPGKIKKIESILGSGYTVKASYGHIIDLAPNKLSIDVNEGFEPLYFVIKHGRQDKSKVIADLKAAYKKGDSILIATDEDREGEMIAWSIAKELGIKNPDRIVFNSITKNELLAAIKSPKKIDENMVNAQKARRVLDRLVGYLVSPLLSKAIGARLSAGRVQSVVVKLLVEREMEIKEFFQGEESSYYLVSGIFGDGYEGILYKKSGNERLKLENHKQAIDIVKRSSNSDFKVNKISVKDSKSSPSPPYTTSTLQQDASRKLGFAAKRTMSIAQKLYEGGFITYMRTDSMSLSKEALGSIKKFVLEEYGDKYYKGINYKSGGKTQEAHEAVRPTKFDRSVFTKLSGENLKLYTLIWKRAVASQMTPAIYQVETADITGTKLIDMMYIVTHKTIKFEGYLKVYGSPEVQGKGIPKKGAIEAISITAKESYDKPPTRYSEASLVSKLDPKNLNIGRPSTYAAIIDRIITVGYIEKKDVNGSVKKTTNITWNTDENIREIEGEVEIGSEKNKLVPTALGITVTDFLEKRFTEIMDYKFTAHMEDSLDNIAEGKVKWKKVIQKFYDMLKPKLDDIQENIKSIQSSTTKELGIHDGKKYCAKNAKYGPVVYTNIKSKTVYAPIKEPLTLETVTLKDAVKLLEYPKDLGTYKGKTILLKTGKYGFYLDWDGKRISMGEDFNPEKLDMKDVQKKIDELEKKYLWEGKEGNTTYKILDGPHGKYIKVDPKGKKGYNVSLSEDVDINNLDIENVKELVNKGMNKKRGYMKRIHGNGNRRGRRRGKR